MEIIEKTFYKMPPRKWYTLEQASEKLTKELNQVFSVDDLVHYLFLGYFLPYIHVKYRINNDIVLNGKYRIELNEENYLSEDVESTMELDFSDLVILSDYCNLAIAKIDYPDNSTSKWLDYFIDNLMDKIRLEYGELNSENFWDKFNNFLIENEKITFGIDGLLAVKIDCLYNGTPLLSEEMEIVNQGLKIKNQDLLTPPMIDLKHKGGFFTLYLENEFYIPASEIIIVYDDLLRIKADIRANLRYFAENADENGIVPDDEKLHIYGKNEQKTTEKNTPQIESIEKTQTPRQYQKSYYKTIVIESSLATARDYPTAGKNTLVKAVINELVTYHGIKRSDLQSEKTYTNALEKTGVNFPNEKGKTIEISKVTIIKP